MSVEQIYVEHWYTKFREMRDQRNRTLVALKVKALEPDNNIDVSTLNAIWPNWRTEESPE